MKKLFSILLQAFLSCSLSAQTIETTTPDGRKVVLRPDKTWEFVTEKPAVEKPVADNEKRKIEGDDLTQIVDLVVSLKGQLAKSEFETEEAFVARLRQLLKTTKNAVTGRSLDQTVLILGASETETFKYYAESQSFKSFFLRFATVEPVGKKYRGYGIDLVRREFGIWAQRYTSNRKLEFTMLAEKAKAIKPHLRWAVYGLPVDVETYGIASLKFLPTKYVAFNSSTSEVYAEIEEEDLMASRYSSVPVWSYRARFNDVLFN